MLLQVEETFGLKLKCALADSDELFQKGNDLVTPPIVPGVILFSGLVIANLVREKTPNCRPVPPSASGVELADRLLIPVHPAIVRRG